MLILSIILIALGVKTIILFLILRSKFKGNTISLIAVILYGLTQILMGIGGLIINTNTSLLFMIAAVIILLTSFAINTYWLIRKLIRK